MTRSRGATPGITVPAESAPRGATLRLLAVGTAGAAGAAAALQSVRQWATEAGVEFD